MNENGLDREESLLRECRELIDWAIEKDRFVLYRQPLQSMNSGRMMLYAGSEPTTYELFLRMIDRDDQILRAGAFIEHATPDQMKAIDRVVLVQAVDLLKKGLVSYSVNLSLETLGDFKFPGWLDDLLVESRINPRRLSIEITEQVAYYLPPMSILTILKDMKISVGMDNFGVGGANFQAMKLIEPDFIKVDGSIVRLMCSDFWCECMVFSMMAMAYRRNIPIILEHIESGLLESRALRLSQYFPGLRVQCQGRLYGSEEPCT